MPETANNASLAEIAALLRSSVDLQRKTLDILQRFASEKQMPKQRRLRVKQAAHYAGIGHHALRGAIDRGELPAEHPGRGKPILICIEDLNDWIQKRKS